MKASKIFDEMVDGLHHSFEKLPDYRTGANTQYEIKDAALSAFGIFFTQSASFLAYQRMLEERKGRSNVGSPFGVERIPSDNQIRNLLDPLEPELLYEAFQQGLKAVEASGQLENFRSYDGQVLISCDGTQIVSSPRGSVPTVRSERFPMKRSSMRTRSSCQWLSKRAKAGCRCWSRSSSAHRTGMRSRVVNEQPSSAG